MRRTLTAIIALLAVMLAGIAYLRWAYKISATRAGTGWLPEYPVAPDGRRDRQRILLLRDDRLGAQRVGPVGQHRLRRLSSVVPGNRLGRLPAKRVAHRGRRLVYSQGILVLAALSGGLLIAFDGITDHLIPLFAVGAFLAFTLSQAGMVEHWRRVGGPHAGKSMVINGSAPFAPR